MTTPAAEPPPGEIRVNCGTFASTLVPFGAVLYRNERSGDRALQRFETGDDGEWLAVSQKGWPIILKNKEESALSTWTYVSIDPMTLVGTWFHDDELRQGPRALATRCDLMLTERALRVGLHAKTVIGRTNSGPWYYSDDKDQVVQLKKHCVFAAVFPYADITRVKGGRNYIEIYVGGAAGMSLVGDIGLDPDEGETQLGKMSVFNIALAEQLLRWGVASDDARKRNAAAQLGTTDWRTGLATRRGLECTFKS